MEKKQIAVVRRYSDDIERFNLFTTQWICVMQSRQCVTGIELYNQRDDGILSTKHIRMPIGGSIELYVE